MNGTLLKKIAKMNGDTLSDLAEVLGMSYITMSLKINGHSDFRQSEIRAIKERYALTGEEILSIFFA